MPYVPNASDVTQPTTDKFVESAAAEFRALKVRVNEISTASGTALGGIAIPDFTINQSTPDSRVFFADTNPAGWNAGAGRMTVRFDLVPVNYFAANPNGHLAVVLRQQLDSVATAVRGQGVAIGNATGFPNGSSDLNPTPLLETFFNSLAGTPGGAANYLWPNSEGARSLPMVDGQTYRFIIDSTKMNDGLRYLRYRMYRYISATQSWRAEVDTGDVLDHNVWAELTQTGLLFGDVFRSNLVGGWALNFYQVGVFWGPAQAPTSDQTIKLSRYGAQLEGNLKFVGGTVRSIDSDAASFDVKTQGTTRANFNALGMTMAGASRTIGQPLDSYYFFSQFGGTNAKSFTDGTTLNIDSLCTDGVIRTFMSATPTNVQVETALRPLYCIVSVLVKELQNKRVI
jgi:hypothetical protein